jgi:hypothetical protein
MGDSSCFEKPRNCELPAASYKLPASSQGQWDLNIDRDSTKTLEGLRLSKKDCEASLS